MCISLSHFPSLTLPLSFSLFLFRNGLVHPGILGVRELRIGDYHPFCSECCCSPQHSLISEQSNGTPGSFLCSARWPLPTVAHTKLLAVRNLYQHHEQWQNQRRNFPTVPESKGAKEQVIIQDHSPSHTLSLSLSLSIYIYKHIYFIQSYIYLCLHLDLYVYLDPLGPSVSKGVQEIA